MRRPSPAAPLFGLSLALALVACGGASPAPSTSAKTSAPLSIDAGAPAPPNLRVPSATLARYWPFDGPATMNAYADVAGLSKTVAGDEQVVLQIVGLVADAKRKVRLQFCGRDVLQHARDILMGGSPGASFFALATTPGAASPLATTCFDDNPAFAKTAPAAGVDRAWAGNDSDGSPLVVDVVGDVVLIGTPSLLTSVLAPSASPHALPKNLSLAEDQYIVLDAEIDGSMAGHFVLTDSDRHLVLETDIAVADAASADALANKLQALTKWPPNAFEGSPTQAITDSLHRLSTALTVDRSGSTVKARFELAEPPSLQGYDVLICANLAATLFPYALHQASLSDTQTTLSGIAQRYAEATDDAAKRSHGAKRLKSYPPVPKKMPAGKEVTTTPAEWSAWKPLGVELSEPQSFQYEIIADKKGTEADVVARGDLRGDGSVTTLKVHVAIDPKSHAIVVGDVAEDAKKAD